MKNLNPKCQVCGKDEKTKICTIPGVPYSAAYCKSCFDANAHPYDLVVSNTWAAGGYNKCANWWQDLVDDTLEHLNISHSKFTKDVDAMEEYDGE